MDIGDQERDLVNLLERALAIADALSLRLVAIKIADALAHFPLGKGKLSDDTDASG